ncbi:hypothetical protein D3C75_1308210 [compost metagenome]
MGESLEQDLHLRFTVQTTVIGQCQFPAALGIKRQLQLQFDRGVEGQDLQTLQQRCMHDTQPSLKTGTPLGQ